MKSKCQFTTLAALGVAVATFSTSAFAEGCGFVGQPACAVPEPSSLPLVGLGIGAVIVVTRFFKKK